MAEKKKMSVAEILAAARKMDGKGSGDTEPEAPAGSTAGSQPTAEAPSEAPVEAPPAETPAAKTVDPAKSGDKPSVAEILAMARANKAAGAAKPAAAAAPAEKPKPAPKPAAAKAEKAAEPVTSGGPKDTSSILAAARKVAKPGPMTKAEAAAAAREKPAVPVAKKPVAVPPMPPKPDYAKPKPAKAAAAADEERRGFLAAALGTFLGLGFTALSATGALWGLGTARFMFPNILTEPPSQFKIGYPANFPPGYVENKFKAQFGIWVVNVEYQGMQQIYALRTVCTHLGCTPNWLDAEQKFKCPCHGSGFYKDGINFEGPAPRPLERYAIRVADDGQLEVDKSRIFQQELGQWSDPQSFVPV